MRRVIADSTPLIALSYIGHLDLLRQLYQQYTDTIIKLTLEQAGEI